MTSSLEHLAAAAAAAVPGLRPTAVGPSPDDDADFRSAVVVDASQRRWRVRSALTDEASMRLAAEHSVLSSFSPGLRSRLPFHMPTVVGSVEDQGRPLFVYSHLPGGPVPIDDLMDLSEAAPARPQPPSAAPVPEAAAQLGQLIAAIHSLPRAMVMDADLPAYSSEQCRRRMLGELDQAATTGRIPSSLLRRWEEALEDRTLWRFSTHVVHGDLHEDNLIVEGNRVTAVTGWSDVHVGDPAGDFASLIGASDPSFAEAVVAEYSRSAPVEPDPHLLRRAHLEAEFALARWLVRGVSRDLPELVADAESMLRVLEKDVELYDREQAVSRGLPAEESVAARTEHARSARERAAAPGPDDGGGRDEDQEQEPEDGATSERPAVGQREDGPGDDQPGGDQAGHEESARRRVLLEGRRRAAADAAHRRTRLSGDLLEDEDASSEHDAAADREARAGGEGPHGATVTPLHRPGAPSSHR